MGLVSQAPEFVADPTVQVTSSGARSVNLQQRYRGLPIFQAGVTVRFAPDSTLTDTIGTTASVSDGKSATPKLAAADAVLAAAKYLAASDPGAPVEKDQFGQSLQAPALDVAGFTPKVRAAFTNTPERPTVLEPGPFGEEIKARLLWFPLLDQLSLGWNVLLTMPGHAGQYNTVVDATTGDMLYCHQTVATVAAVGNVYQVDGGAPRQLTKFPRPLTDYPLSAPTATQGNWRWCHKCQSLFFSLNGTAGACAAGSGHDATGSGDYGLLLEGNGLSGFPDDWITANKTVGNATNAHLNEAGATLSGTVVDGVLTFNPANVTGDDQKILNIFYYCSYMHDFSYLLGLAVPQTAPGNDTFKPGTTSGMPPQGNDAKCGFACHTKVKEKDYVFTEYGKR
jgi:extracellular elastinolytic metalloproteinase